jgi:hypothetical protein
MKGATCSCWGPGLEDQVRGRKALGSCLVSGYGGRKEMKEKLVA